MVLDVANDPRILHPATELYPRVTAITEKAQELGLKVSEMKPSPAIVGKRFNRIPIKLAGVGSYVSFREFVKAAALRAGVLPPRTALTTPAVSPDITSQTLGGH